MKTMEQFKQKEENKQSQIIKDKILIAKELARQWFESSVDETEEEKERSLINTKKQIISWQVDNGLKDEEIEEILKAFDLKLKEKETEELDKKIDKGLNALGQAIEEKRLNTKKERDGDEDGIAA
jgi:hypothetical protein